MAYIKKNNRKIWQKIYKLLNEHSDELVTYERIVKALWGESYPCDEYSKNAIRVHLVEVRKFIKEKGYKRSVESIRKQGLILRVKSYEQDNATV